MIAAYRRFNEWLAAKITAAVSTMTCAYVFAALACVSLPEAIHGGPATLVAWIAQTFLQLVLLSVIMVGQEAQQRRHDDHAQSLDALHEKHDAVMDMHERHAKDLTLLHKKHDDLHAKTDKMRATIKPKRTTK